MPANFMNMGQQFPQMFNNMRPGANRQGWPGPGMQQMQQMPQMPLMPQGPFGNAGRFGGMYQNPQMSPVGGQQMLPNMMGAFFGAGGLRGY